MSTQISAEKVKELRHKTGVGMSKCKEALVLAEGDMAKAIEHLRKAGVASSVKKEGREVKEGLIGVAENSADIALVEVNAETDFVVKNEKFHSFVKAVVEQAVKEKPVSVEKLLKAKSAKDASLSVDEARSLFVQAIGENIQINRLKILPKEKNTSYGIYSHMGGKIVSIVAIQGSASEKELARDIAMHVAAEDPDYLASKDIPVDILDREKEIARSQIKGKPANIVEKILEGKMEAYYNQACLLNQKYIKDTSVSVEQFVKKYGKDKSLDLKIRGFWRWKVGQSS